MKTYEFKASVITSEINLNAISSHFGINKKYKWEDPLILNENLLRGIIPHPEDKYVYIFFFGSIASINLTIHELKDVVLYLKKLDKNLKENTSFNYIEDFKLIIDEKAEFEVNYDSIVVDSLKDHQLSIVATILAKSVALKKIEVDTDILLDEIERIIVLLDKGHLKISDEQLAKMSSKILRFKYNTLSYLMLLDKPDIAWNIEAAEDIFVQLSDLFELKERYDKIRHKTEVLLDITEVFSSLSHAKRGTRLEWAVIILILIEIVLGLWDRFMAFIR